MLHWSDIRGQKRPLSILEKALDTGRVHHAYLFTGLEGVGKFRTAHTFASIVNCLERTEGAFEDACGQCSSCRRTAERQHPDVLFIEPVKDRIKIAQIREVQQASTKAPYEARFRFVLIDDAHTMTEQAANALLKTLEEPSARMRLILVTDQPHGLLDTIISRCQILRFGALDESRVIELLEQGLAESDRIDEMPERSLLEVAAGYGEGSVGRSLEILESGMLSERTKFIRRVVDLPSDQSVPLLDLAEELSSSRHELDSRLDVLKLFLRDVVIFKTRDGDRALVDRDLRELVADYARRTPVDAVLESIDRVRRAQELIQRNVHAQLITEELLGHFQAQAASANARAR